MDLLSLVLTLKPLPYDGEASPRVWWGRAAQALLLATISARNEKLAVDLHEGGSSIRPFTVSTLMGRFSKGALLPDQTYMLRLTAFESEAAGILWDEANTGALSRGKIVELDYQKFEVVGESTNAGDGQSGAGGRTPWEQRTGYQALSAPFLLSTEQAPRRISFQFTSPTTFKSGGKHFPMPTPALVFGSLLDRWNAFAPVAFPPEVKRYAEECLAISKYDLKTKPIPQKDAGLRVGAVGNVTFTSVSYDRYWMSVLATLAEFSLFCGLGAGTAQGLGQCRRIAD